MEACKLNNINPREYFLYVVAVIHQEMEPPAPYEYATLKEENRISIPDR
ncbi:MAG: hypothetical protein OXB84_02805 [Halobacteriovoraceae bacterium]|nr:hypothetical protein [Halobacteriovoraceae bacterium]